MYETYREQISLQEKFTPEAFQYFSDMIKTHKGDYIQFDTEDIFRSYEFSHSMIFAVVYKDNLND